MSRTKHIRNFLIAIMIVTGTFTMIGTFLPILLKAQKDNTSMDSEQMADNLRSLLSGNKKQILSVCTNEQFIRLGCTSISPADD